MHSTQSETDDKSNLPTPRELSQNLDEYVIGQDDAKKVQRDVYDYTKKVLGDFKAAGALPEMV